MILRFIFISVVALSSVAGEPDNDEEPSKRGKPSKEDCQKLFDDVFCKNTMDINEKHFNWKDCNIKKTKESVEEVTITLDEKECQIFTTKEKQAGVLQRCRGLFDNVCTKKVFDTEIVNDEDWKRCKIEKTVKDDNEKDLLIISYTAQESFSSTSKCEVYSSAEYQKKKCNNLFDTLCTKGKSSAKVTEEKINEEENVIEIENRLKNEGCKVEKHQENHYTKYKYNEKDCQVPDSCRELFEEICKKPGYDDNSAIEYRLKYNNKECGLINENKPKMKIELGSESCELNHVHSESWDDRKNSGKPPRNCEKEFNKVCHNEKASMQEIIDLEKSCNPICTNGNANSFPSSKSTKPRKSMEESCEKGTFFSRDDIKPNDANDTNQLREVKMKKTIEIRLQDQKCEINLI